MKLVKTSFREFAEYVEEKNKSIVFWGAGAIGRVLIPYICSRYSLDGRVIGYIDNNPAKQGEEIVLGSKKVRIYSSTFLESLRAGGYVLMITNGDFYSVLEQLQDMPAMADVPVCIAPVIQLSEKAESKLTGIYQSSIEPLIPKVIHYCWFSGRQIPQKLKDCMKSWHEKCPDYEIVRWDETNYDYKKFPYTKEAYEAEKYGFIPDIVRLEILYQYGGFYLDTDVKLLKSLDELRYQQGFCGREEWGHVNFGGGSGCVKHLDMVGELLDFRREVPFLLPGGCYNMESSGYFETKPFVDKGLSVTNRTEVVNGFTVYASEFFHPYNYISGKENITPNTVSIHYFSGSWLGEEGTLHRRKSREQFETVLRQMKPFSKSEK